MIIFTALILLVMTALTVFVRTVIYNAQYNEVQRVYNIAGAVLSEYPQAEQIFVNAVMNEDHKNESYGENIMSHYGYDTEMELNKQYKKTLIVYYTVLLAFSVCILFGGYAGFRFISKRKKVRENNLIEIIDSCLSGDYSFIGDERRMRIFNNTLFADLLMKLAENMRLKTEYLNEEHDNTKTLVTDISHQLKTPISAMKACFDMYVEADTENEKAEFLNRSRIQMDKLENLASALINVSRLENGMITLQKTDTSIKEIIIGAVNTVYHKALKKNIEIVTSKFEDIPLHLDMKWTVEAIANILDNAIKYSQCGSDIQIRAQKLYSFVRVEIEDKGIGIPKEEQNKIFTRFYRGNNDIVKNQEGSGIGLYLSRSILEEQGGTVSVRSSLGKGSIFVIQLPL